MKVVWKLAFESILRNPVRSLLAALGMIAAASVVSWLVSGYDAMFSEFNRDPGKIENRFDFLLMSTGEDSGQGIRRNLTDALSADPRLAECSLFSTPVRVNARKKTLSSSSSPASSRSPRPSDRRIPSPENRRGGENLSSGTAAERKAPGRPSPGDVGKESAPEMRRGRTGKKETANGTESTTESTTESRTENATGREKGGDGNADSGLPAVGRERENLLSIVTGGGRPPASPGMGKRPGGGPPRGGRGMRGSGGELAPVTYGLPTGGGFALQGTTPGSASPYRIKEGSWLSPEAPLFGSKATGPFPAVLSESAAERLGGAAPRDVLEMASNAGFFTLKVVGIMEEGPSVRKLAQVPPGQDGRVSFSSGIFVHWSSAEHLSGTSLSPESAILRLKKPSECAVFAQEWKSRAEEADRNAFLASYPEVLEALKNPEPGSGRNMAQAYGATGISMLVSFFIIFTTLSMGVEERIRQFAVLRIVAFRRGQLALLILLESLILGLAGWFGGLASGWILLRILESGGEAAAAGPEMKIGFWTIALTGVCSMAGAAAAAVLPMIRAARIRPLDALTPSSGALLSGGFFSGSSEGKKGERKERRRGGGKGRKEWILFAAGILLLCVNPLVVSLPGLKDMTRVVLYGVAGCPAMALGFVCLAPLMTRLCGWVFFRPLARILGLNPVFLRSQWRANFWRSTGTVVSLSIGLGFFMMILIWSSSMLIPYIPGSWMPDYFLSVIPGGLNEQTAGEVAKIRGVLPGKCLPVAVEQVKLAEDLTGSRERQSVVRQDNVVFFGVDVDRGLGGKDPLFPFRFLSGNREEALKLLKEKSGNYCLIPHYFAETAHLKTGDRFSVRPPNPAEAPVEFRVAGIIEMNGWHWFSKVSGTRRNFGRTAAMLFASRESVEKSFGLTRVNYLWMNLEPGADESFIRRSVERLAESNAGESFRVIGGGESEVGRETVRATSKRELERSLMGRTNMMVDGMLRMPLLILLVVSLSVANTAVASVRARRREIGIMRSVGLSAWGLIRLVLAEGILIALAASVLSFCFGIASGLCSAQMAAHSTFFGGMGWSFDIPWSRIADGVIFTVGLCFLASLIPAAAAGLTKPLKLLQNGLQE